MEKSKQCSRCKAPVGPTSLHVISGDVICASCARERPRPNLVVLVADPPWRMSDQLAGDGRGATKHYETMSIEEIERMTLPTSFLRARNAVLFLWLLEAMQFEALRIAMAWRCMPYGSIVWNKFRATKKGPRPHMGMGHITRAGHERCLVAVRGEYERGYKPAVHDERSNFDALMPVDEDGELIHSAKPDEFFAKVERLYPKADARHEMFSRRSRAGWLQYGKELGKLDAVAGESC